MSSLPAATKRPRSATPGETKNSKKTNTPALVAQLVAEPVAAPVAPLVAEPVKKTKAAKPKAAPVAAAAPAAPAAPVAPAEEKPVRVRQRKPRATVPFPNFCDWTPESLATMRAYVQDLSAHYSDKAMVQFVRRLIRQVVTEGDKKYRPISNFDKSLLKYKARLESGSYTDSKGRVHSFDMNDLKKLQGKWLSHYKVTEMRTFDWIKANVRNESIYQVVPAEVLMLIQVLHSKKITIKGVVPHGTVVEKVDGVERTRAKHDLGPEESLRVYVGPSVPFEKCYVIGPEYAFDPRKDGVKQRVEDYKSGQQRYLSLIPLVQEVAGKKGEEAASGAGADE